MTGNIMVNGERALRELTRDASTRPRLARDDNVLFIFLAAVEFTCLKLRGALRN